jgi:L-lactate dehydrogenase (cytochrome)
MGFRPTFPLARAHAISDYRTLARQRLPHFLFEYIDGGSFGEGTLHRNRTALDAITLNQRVLRDVSSIDTSATLFGQNLSLPVILGPVGLAGMNARRGEVQAARAAEQAGIPFCLSTVSACPIGEVAAGTSRPFWFQLYMIRDRAFMRDLLAEARAAGCNTLVFTVDMPVPGTRYRDYRSGLAGASGPLGALRRIMQAMVRPRWAWDVGLWGRPHALGNVAPVLGRNSGLEDFFAWMRDNFDPSVTWADLEFIRSEWRGPLVIKGIMDPDDATKAADLGADGIIVSNHGGRQLDGAAATVEVLPRIAEVAGHRLTVMADGGVRSGLDVVRMLASGAKAVLLGRAWAYALAAAGETGVSHILEMMAAEMRVAMALTGATRICDINTEILFDTNR